MKAFFWVLAAGALASAVLAATLSRAAGHAPATHGARASR